MSTWHKTDLEETRSQLKNQNPITDGMTWLRHHVDKQAGVIDLMLLKGLYSVEEIASELNKRFIPQRTLAARIKRVRDHIEHLQDGDARNKLSAMKPHKLRLKEVDGMWQFDV